MSSKYYARPDLSSVTSTRRLARATLWGSFSAITWNSMSSTDKGDLGGFPDKGVTTTVGRQQGPWPSQHHGTVHDKDSIQLISIPPLRSKESDHVEVSRSV